MYKDILIAVDLNEESSWAKALPLAVEFCQGFDSTLHLMTVVPDFGLSLVGQFFPEGHTEKMLEEANVRLHKFSESHIPNGVRVQHIVGQGTIYEVILNVARQASADLIIVAASRPELKDYLLGPNAARVVRHAECSVLVVRD